jgi:hypothetical protein
MILPGDPNVENAAPSSRADEFWKYFPALKPLAAILVFSFRLTGALFGLIFSGGAAYLLYRFVVPAVIDSARAPGERWGAAAFAILPLLFFGIGVFILRDSITRKSFPNATTPRTLPERGEMVRLAKRSRNTTVVGLQRRGDGQVVLSSASIYRLLAVFVGVFAAIWNGVILISAQSFGGFQTWLSILYCTFMIPFATIGLGLIYVFWKLVSSLRQPVVEITAPKETYAKGEEVRAEIRLRDPKRKTKRLRVTLSKRGLVPDEDDPVLKTSAVIAERKLLEIDGGELDGDWTTAVSFRLDATEEEWSEWALEIEVLSDQPLPQYLALPLHFELE